MKYQGHDVTEVSSSNCDLRDASSLHQFDHETFDCIYHLAVWTQAGDFCTKHAADQWLINQQINTNMLDWWHHHQPRAKLIAMGTSCSYDPTYPLQEEYYLSGAPIESLLAYGMTKRMLLAGLMSFHQQYGHDYLFLIPSTLYGIEGYHTDGKQLHFIFDLIRKILRGKFYNEPVVLWGDGEQKRELIHVEDFVKAMVELSTTQKNQAFNLGEGREHSIREFAHMIAEQVGYPVEQIEYDESRYVGARSKVLLLEKIRQVLPNYTPRTPQEGIVDIIEWLSQHPQFL